MPDAPGAPGIVPRWTSSDKSGVGTALVATSRVWFTISHGILNECYYPRVDQACTRDFGFIVTDGEGFFAEEKRDTETTIAALTDGVPAYEVTNTHQPGNGGAPRFRIRKRIIADPRRDVVLQSVTLEALAPGPRLRLFALLAPHLVNAGNGNNAWLDEYKGQKMLFAEGGGAALALAADVPWLARSVGFAGVSDGWQDLSRYFRLTWEYDRAVAGNVALAGEVDLPPDGTAVFALGFGRSPIEAAFRARASLLDDFAALAAEYAQGWRAWQAGLRKLDRVPASGSRQAAAHEGRVPEGRVPEGWAHGARAHGARADGTQADGTQADGTQADGTHRYSTPLDEPRPHEDRGPEQHAQDAQVHNTYRVSTAVLRTHEAPDFRGGYIASLSIPWGSAKGDDDLGGYHLVWPRDLVETAGGLLAAGAPAEAVQVLDYLRATQEADGHWPQNNWLDGSAYWQGVQMDECAFPILLVDLARRESALGEADMARFWPMVRAAAGFLVRKGPVTGQDRWEENAGYATFTLSVEIAAILVAGELAGKAGEPAMARFLTDTADYWHACLDGWTFARGTKLAAELGVDGYYVRMAPARPPSAASDLDGMVQIKNRPEGQGMYPAAEVISADALALVRFGLRRADDPRILSTIRAIDHATCRRLPAGPAWYRYTGDGYGEQADGAPFNGAGHGRLWPLLTGERAHYAIAAGDLAEAASLLDTMEACASRGALLPEQVWDAGDVPARELSLGHPSGSAMPLVWAHAEHIKLLRSLADRAVFDMPPQTVRRYLSETHTRRVIPWRVGFQPDRLPPDCTLRIELTQASIVHWSNDGWATSNEQETTDTGLGVHVAELGWENRRGDGFVFTWRDARTQAWTGRNYHVTT